MIMNKSRINFDLSVTGKQAPLGTCQSIGSVPESFVKAFNAFKICDEAHDGESIRSAFKAQEAWSNLQRELIAWVEREQNVSNDVSGRSEADERFCGMPDCLGNECEPEPDEDERCDQCGQTSGCLLNGLCPMCYETGGGVLR